MNNLSKFVLVGLSVVAVGEFELAVIFRGDLLGYAITMALYVVVLILAYGILRYAQKKWPNAKADIYYFISISIFGLLLEWFLLGTAPWLDAEANQFGMLAWWGAVGLVPRIFIDTASTGSVKKRIKFILLLFSLGTLAAVVPLHFLRFDTVAYQIFFFSWLASYLSLYFVYAAYLAKGAYEQNIKKYKKLAVVMVILALVTQFIK